LTKLDKLVVGYIFVGIYFYKSENKK